jgi:transcriptional regulator with XRE-family HTH domain
MVQFETNLKRILMERGITQKEFAEMTGLREATISEFANNSRTTINKDQLVVIMKTLGIKDISRIVYINWNEEE